MLYLAQQSKLFLGDLTRPMITVTIWIYCVQAGPTRRTHPGQQQDDQTQNLLSAASTFLTPIIAPLLSQILRG